MEGNFRDAFAGGDQQREEPRVERRMRLSAHIDIAAHEDVRGVLGMQRLDLRVGGLGEIEDVVALEGLVEKRQAQGKDDQRDEDELAAQEIKIAGRARAGTGERTAGYLHIEHHAEARLAAQHVLVSFGGAIERKDFVHGMDAGEDAEIQRVFGIDGRAGVPALDGLIRARAFAAYSLPVTEPRR